MNKFLWSAAVVTLFALSSCGEQADAGTEAAVTTEQAEGTDAEVTTDHVEEKTSITFAEEAFDFGTISQGEKVEHTFKFTNAGDHDLVIVSAKGSCGCTIPKWPAEPIAPGAEGEIFVVFNSEGKSGKQHKKVTIVANTEPSTTVIALRGEVIAPEEPAAEQKPANE